MKSFRFEFSLKHRRNADKKIYKVGHHFLGSVEVYPCLDDQKGNEDMEKTESPQHRTIPWYYIRFRKRGEYVLGITLDAQWNPSYFHGEL